MGKPGSKGLENLRVLIVEDNAHSLTILKTILHGLGVGDIRTAADAGDGFRTMREARPDIVFVDWLMAPLDGLDFVRLVRKAEDSPDPLAPIVMLTGHSQAHRVKEARDAGVTEFIAKPVSAESVIARLSAVIHRPRAFVRAPGYVGPDRRRRARTFDGPDRRASREEPPATGDA
jgi:two-component system, chemotaxis family, chemotaxis protein CheY